MLAVSGKISDYRSSQKEASAPTMYMHACVCVFIPMHMKEGEQKKNAIIKYSTYYRTKRTVAEDDKQQQ